MNFKLWFIPIIANCKIMRFPMFLEVELHVYFHTFKPIEEIYKFWDEVSLFSWLSMNIAMFWDEFDVWVIKPQVYVLIFQEKWCFKHPMS